MGLVPAHWGCVAAGAAANIDSSMLCEVGNETAHRRLRRSQVHIEGRELGGQIWASLWQHHVCERVCKCVCVCKWKGGGGRGGVGPQGRKGGGVVVITRLACSDHIRIKLDIADRCLLLLAANCACWLARKRGTGGRRRGGPARGEKVGRRSAGSDNRRRPRVRARVSVCRAHACDRRACVLVERAGMCEI